MFGGSSAGTGEVRRNGGSAGRAGTGGQSKPYSMYGVVVEFFRDFSGIYSKPYSKYGVVVEFL